MDRKKRNYRVAGFLACLFLLVSFEAFGGQRIDGNLQLGTATIADDGSGNVANSTGSFVGRIRTGGGGAAGDLFQAGIDSSGTIWWRIGSTGVPLFWNGSAYTSPLVNPMTTAGDMIVGGTGGTLARAPAGTDGYVWTMSPSTHLPGWAAPSTPTATTNTVCRTDLAPASGRTLPIWRAPAASVLSGTHYLLKGATSLVGQIRLCDGNGANCLNTQSSDVTAAAGTNADGTVPPSNIGAGDYVEMKETTLNGSSPVSYTACFDYTLGVVVPCTNLSVSIWENFEFSTLTTANLAANQNGTGGVWSITDTESKLSISTSGQQNLVSCPGNVSDNGTMGLKADNSSGTATSAYVTYTFPAGTTTISYGYWLYVGTLPDSTAVYPSDVTGTAEVELYNTGSVTEALARGATNTAPITLPTVPAWYYITVKAITGSTLTIHIYDATATELSGSPQSATTDAYGFTSLDLGLAGTFTAASFTLYFDNLLIDLSGTTYPLGP